MKYFILTTAILIFFVGTVHGHGLGQSLEKEIGDYVIDVGYDASDKVYAGEAIRFDFNLWKKNRTDVADFDHIWLRIAPKEEGILFAGFLYRPEFLLTGMSYAFAEAGQYELTVRFLDKDDKNLAEASFPIDAVSEEAPFASLMSVGTLAGFLFGALVGAGIVFLTTRKKTVT